MTKAYVAERPKPILSARPAASAVRQPRPTLDHQATTVPNPLADLPSLEDGALIEEVSAEAFAKVKSAYREQERRALSEAMNDAPLGFYRVLVFGNDAQAAAFVQAVGQDSAMQFIDGRRVADHLGIALPPDTWKTNRRFVAPDRRLAALALK